MNNDWAFLPMRSANGLLGDVDALAERLAEDGYLYFSQVLPIDRLKAIRRDVTGVLAAAGWIAGGDRQSRAVSTSRPYLESDEEFQAVYAEIQKLQSFHELAHHQSLAEIMQQVLGATAFPHPLKVARISFPGSFETTTPPHQDFPNNQGTESLTAAWIPLSDITTVLGGLAVLRGSHQEDILELTGHLGPGNRQADLPLELLERRRWVTTNYSLGDVLLFPSKTIHASLHNASQGVMRLSIDYRFQPEGEALTPGCLEPHGRRVTWDEIYEKWTSTEWQYYWHDLDYRVEEMTDYQVRLQEESNLAMLKLRMQHDMRVKSYVAPPTNGG
jgi:ectoine hydroxylase-related dioxygenase (phytanoyl-CoA dioxygenase family)